MQRKTSLSNDAHSVFRRHTVATVMGTALAMSGCTVDPIVLPARSAPPKVVPAVALPSDTPPPGKARFILGTTDGPMRVRLQPEYLGGSPPGSRSTSRPTDLCTTPCVVDLAPGRYKLFLSSPDGAFGSRDSDIVQLDEGLNHYVRAPSKDTASTIPTAPTIVIVTSVAATLVGQSLLLSRPWFSEPTSKQERKDNIGLGLEIFGLIGVLTGSVVYSYEKYETRGVVQPGATTFWH